MANLIKVPKVSVCVITYNHVHYIRECLQSIVDQETTFEFELIVGDDASTDGTQAIVTEFADRYPDKVVAILHPTNIGGTKNYFYIHALARGEYIAHVDGDDVALPGKLQKQANVLDAEPRTAYVVHECRVVDAVDNCLRPSLCGTDIPLLTDINYLMMKQCFFTHSSKMYRRKHRVATQPHDEVVDFYFHVAHLQGGLIRWLPEVLGVYRSHAGGVSQRLRSSVFRAYMDGFEAMSVLNIDSRLVAKSRLRSRYSFAIWALKDGDLALFKQLIHVPLRELFNASLKHLTIVCLSRLGLENFIAWYAFK